MADLFLICMISMICMIYCSSCYYVRAVQSVQSSTCVLSCICIYRDPAQHIITAGWGLDDLSIYYLSGLNIIYLSEVCVIQHRTKIPFTLCCFQFGESERLCASNAVDAINETG